MLSADCIVCKFFYDLFYKSLQNRVEYYKYVNKYLNGHNLNVCCKIGSKSKTCQVYSCKAEQCSILKFACKKRAAKIDIILSIKLSALVLRGINPHFNIVYRYSRSNGLLCELAKGDLKMFLKGYIRYDVLINCVEQIILSILSFHVHTGLKHNDCYHGNFLYHRIVKDAGICYTVNDLKVCIKNLGYLWVINDFDLVDDVNDDSELYQDYLDAMEAFVKYKKNSKFNREFAKILQIIKNNKNAYDMIKSLQLNTELFNHVLLQSDRIYFI